MRVVEAGGIGAAGSGGERFGVTNRMDAPKYVPLDEPFLIVTQIVEAGVERIFPSTVTATCVGATVRRAAGGPTGPLLPPPQAASVTTVATHARRARLAKVCSSVSAQLCRITYSEKLDYIGFPLMTCRSSYAGSHPWTQPGATGTPTPTDPRLIARFCFQGPLSSNFGARSELS